MNTKLLCTLGPASLNSRSIKRLEDIGASLFRHNLSHISLADIRDLIDIVQSVISVPLCPDTEGAQTRTAAAPADNGHAVRRWPADAVQNTHAGRDHQAYGRRPVQRLMDAGKAFDEKRGV